MLRTEEAAKILGVTKSTLESWRCRGGVLLPFVRYGRAIRYREQDVEDFIVSNVRRNTSEPQGRALAGG
jgi:excisionase family DNA binding protein